jgi:hypothetical protein
LKSGIQCSEQDFRRQKRSMLAMMSPAGLVQTNRAV